MVGYITGLLTDQKEFEDYNIIYWALTDYLVRKKIKVNEKKVTHLTKISEQRNTMQFLDCKREHPIRIEIL